MGGRKSLAKARQQGLGWRPHGVVVGAPRGEPAGPRPEAQVKQRVGCQRGCFGVLASGPWDLVQVPTLAWF